jgi:hypothetical protein
MTQETAAQNIKNQFKSSTENEKIEKFKRKQFYWKIARSLVDKEQFLVWLCSPGMKGGTESLII